MYTCVFFVSLQLLVPKKDATHYDALLGRLYLNSNSMNSVAMPSPKKDANYYNALLCLPDNSNTIKGFIVCNTLGPANRSGPKILSTIQ